MSTPSYSDEIRYCREQIQYYQSRLEKLSVLKCHKKTLDEELEDLEKNMQSLGKKDNSVDSAASYFDENPKITSRMGHANAEVALAADRELQVKLAQQRQKYIDQGFSMKEAIQKVAGEPTSNPFLLFQEEIPKVEEETQDEIIEEEED